jgi:hypothetical protein
MDGNNIDDGGVIFLREQADADADVAGQGQIWVDTQTPNVLFFTDDAGTDHQLSGTNPIGLHDIDFEATGMWPSTTNGCAALAKTELGTNDVDIQTLDFDQTTEEYAQFSWKPPRNWNEGTITAVFDWSTTATSGDCIWALQGTAVGDDDAMDAAWGTAQTVTDTAKATASDLATTSATSAITIGGTPTEGDRIHFRVYRDADAAGDTLAADARLHGIRITFTTSAATAA